MSWKGFFEGIQEFSEEILFAPYNALRTIALDSWWISNIMSWVLAGLGIGAFFYWMIKLAKINARGEEDRTQIAHSFLGDD